jgi:hypothetical protein
MKRFKISMLKILRTKFFLFFPIAFLFIFIFNIKLALADDCFCGPTKVNIGSFGLEDQCRQDCQTKGYTTYIYGTAAAKPVTTTVAPNNPTNLGGGCYCDGTYIGNFGVETGCKTDCFNRKTVNYNYQNTGNKATGYTALTTTTNTTTSGSSSGGLVYTPMEQIPGFGKPGDFPSHIMAVYNFGLWVVGLAALLMISIGGFIYITSAGNNSQTGKAKAIITDAIIGILMALTSYLLLYTINPALVQIQPLKPLEGAPGTGAAGVPGVPGGPGGTTNGYKAACPNTSATTPIDYTKAASDNNIKVSSNCDKYNFTNNSGVDPKLLKSIAQLETSCGSNNVTSTSGACGLMQMLPSTARKLGGLSGDDATICNQLKSNDALAIQLASKYVSQASSDPCVTSASNKNAALFAGYNSGYGCGSAACSPKHALCASSDCQAGTRAFECCVNPGGLDQSINYAWNGMGLMSK